MHLVSFIYPVPCIYPVTFYWISAVLRPPDSGLSPYRLSLIPEIKPLSHEFDTGKIGPVLYCIMKKHRYYLTTLKFAGELRWTPLRWTPKKSIKQDVCAACILGWGWNHPDLLRMAGEGSHPPPRKLARRDFLRGHQIKDGKE